jgi:hypothetical protein
MNTSLEPNKIAQAPCTEFEMKTSIKAWAQVLMTIPIIFRCNLEKKCGWLQ